MSSTFTVTCWGCNYSETHPYGGPGEDYDSRIAEMKARGWQRREFGPGADPWFCSHNCAYQSYNAQQCEQWWADKEFQEYCNRKLIHPRYYGLLGIAAFAAILVLAALITPWIQHVRLP